MKQNKLWMIFEIFCVICQCPIDVLKAMSGLLVTVTL